MPGLVIELASVALSQEPEVYWNEVPRYLHFRVTRTQIRQQSGQTETRSTQKVAQNGPSCTHNC